MLDSIYHIPPKLLFNPDVLCEKNANILPRRRYYATLLRSLPTPGRFFFQKIDFFHFLIFCSTSYYKQNNAK